MKESLANNFAKIYAEPAQVFAQAPGRIEFIGNHTDYNGGFTMGVAIDKVVMCALAKRSDRKICFGNIRSGEKIILDMDDIRPQPKRLNWVNYPLGVFKFLLEDGLIADCGFDMLDMSTLPPGAGLSSSAAIELSSGFAMAKLYEHQIELKNMVRIGRKSENLFVGMPCGILDQGVSGFGKADSIVFIDCLTEEFSNLPLPHSCQFWLFNSTKKHALVDGLYAQRHNECMEAAKILSQGGKSKLLRSFSIEDLNAAITVSLMLSFVLPASATASNCFNCLPVMCLTLYLVASPESAVNTTTSALSSMVTPSTDVISPLAPSFSNTPSTGESLSMITL